MIKRYVPRGQLLDIGCAGGYLLEVARDEFGYDVKGIEVSEEMSTRARSRGLDVLTGLIENIPSDWKRFDIVYMGDVLEHIPMPRPLMEKIKPQMEQGSILVLELPLTYNLTLSGILIGIANMFKGNFGYRYFLPAQHRHGLEQKPPYHVLMFSRRSIRNFFRRQGFAIRYLKVYEGEPKLKFIGTWYGWLKRMTHWFTYNMPQSLLGDRMLVIAEKI